MDFSEGSYPKLILGEAIYDFKKEYDGPVVSCRDLSELKDAIAYYIGVKHLDRELVIEDLSFVGRSSNLALLKFVEETPLKLILLSRYDQVDEILLSRINTVFKYNKDSVESMFLTAGEGNRRIEERLSDNTHYFDKVRYMSSFSPKLIMVDKKMKVTRLKKKALQMMD